MQYKVECYVQSIHVIIIVLASHLYHLQLSHVQAELNLVFESKHFSFSRIRLVSSKMNITYFLCKPKSKLVLKQNIKSESLSMKIARLSLTYLT